MGNLISVNIKKLRIAKNLGYLMRLLCIGTKHLK